MPGRMIWCPKCENNWLDDKRCSICRLSIEELLEYMIEFFEETKEKGSDEVGIDEVTDACKDMHCGVAKANELLQKKIDDQDKEMTAINTENWKLKKRNKKLLKKLEEIGLNYSGLCPGCGNNSVKRNRCSICFFEGNQFVVSMINSLKKERGGV